MEPILAYIDPGSGSLIVQVVIASFLAVPFFLRAQIRHGIAAIRGRRPDPTADIERRGGP
jgi:hypothetical protein